MVTNIYDTLGTDLNELLENEEITEINVNENGEVFIKKLVSFDKITEKTNIIMHPERISLILKAVAEYAGLKLKEGNNNLITAILPNKERINGIISAEGLVLKVPIFTIHKCRIVEKFNLDTYISAGSFSQKQVETIKDYIKSHKNIMVVGISGAGKSTFLNTCLREIEKTDNNEKIALIKHTPYVECKANNVITLMSEYDKFDETIRMITNFNPDRIIIDDLSDDLGMYGLVQALDKGIGGVIFSLLAYDEERALVKLNNYTKELYNIYDDYIEQVKVNVNLIVTCYKDENYNRKVKIFKIDGYDKENKKYILEEIK